MTPLVGLGIAGLGAAAAGGGIANWLSSRDAASNYRKASDAYNAQMEQALGQYQAGAQNAIDGYATGSQQYLNTPEGVNKWLNPNMDYQLRQVASANNQQYAAGGKMLSGAAMKSLQDRSQNVAKLSWQDAFNNMSASNSQGLSQAGNLANMNLGLSSNIFNAQQGMAANQMSAAMGQPASGAASFLTGAARGLKLGTGLINAFSSSPRAPGATTQGAA